MNFRGFTIIEVLVSIAIIAIVAGLGSSAFVSTRKNAGLNASTDGIVSVLEQARSNALAGKDGASFGVKFDASSYTFFSGDSYNSSDPSNIIYRPNTGFSLSNSLGSGGTVVFRRLTGLPSHTGTITVTQTAPTKTQVITIGSQGSLSVQK